jgi:uncharacterized membrane protein
MKNVAQEKQVSLLRSNSGLISIDFIFGFLLSFAFLMIFFALAYSLTIVEVVQYIAFASSRTYMASDVSDVEQTTNAQAKANKLKALFLKHMDNSWFVMGSENGAVLQIAKTDPDAKEFAIGVHIPLTLKLLDFKIPFFGSTKLTNPGQGFQTTLSSYLITEPTEKEINLFNDKRYEQIVKKAVDGHYDPALNSKVFRISDNG